MRVMREYLARHAAGVTSALVLVLVAALGVILTEWGPVWTLPYYGGVGAALVRRLFSKKDAGWDQQAFFEAFLVGAVMGLLTFPALGAIPFVFVETLLLKLDQPGEQALVVAFLSYVASHVVAARIRDKIPALLGAKVDAEIAKVSVTQSVTVSEKTVTETQPKG